MEKRNLTFLIIQWEYPQRISVPACAVQYAYFLDEDKNEVIKKEIKSEVK